MNGVTFGDCHSFRDFGLVLQKVVLPNPEAKVYEVDIPGGDGSLDLTEVMGGIHYNNRTMEFTFAFPKGLHLRYAVNSDIASRLHGRKLHITLDDDEGYYYAGRVNYKEWAVDKSLGILTISVSAEPYKYETTSSLEEWLWNPFDFENGLIREYKDLKVNGILELEIPGLQKPVIPTIISSSTMTVRFIGKEYVLKPGANKIYGISITEGDNSLIFSGNGTVSVDYRGGIL